jgi:hypothetical protein
MVILKNACKLNVLFPYTFSSDSLCRDLGFHLPGQSRLQYAFKHDFRHAKCIRRLILINQISWFHEGIMRESKVASLMLKALVVVGHLHLGKKFFQDVNL